MVKSNVLVLGGGPAGLAMAACLEMERIDYLLLESSESVGASWRSHYDRLRLHTIKERSCLPGMSYPSRYPKYISRDQMINYLEQYADHFDIRPQFGQLVSMISPVQKGEWCVETTSGKKYISSEVVIATGVSRIPRQPSWPGQEEFKGQILHSRDYRNPLPFCGKRILVVGMGNTGAEVALDLSEQQIEVDISVRGKVNIVPLEVFGNSTQLTAAKLSKLPNWLGDWLGKVISGLTRKRLYGDLRPYGIDLSDAAPGRQKRETGRTPVIDLGTVEAIKKGRIHVRPNIRQMTSSGVIFSDDQQADYDAVILATGYETGLEKLIWSGQDLLDVNGYPREVSAVGKHVGLHFVGFDNYTPLAILGSINRDVPKVAKRIKTRLEKIG